MEQIDKVLAGLEKLAKAAGETLTVEVDNVSGTWMILFRAGESAAVQTPLRTFSRVPLIVFDSFGEQLIKSIK